MKSQGQRDSRRQEIRTAQRYGGYTNPGSGNGWQYKNDVRTERFSFECKTTRSRSFSLKLDDLLTAETHALSEGRDMVFSIEMGGRTWQLLPQDVFDDLAGFSSNSPTDLNHPNGPREKQNAGDCGSPEDSTHGSKTTKTP